VRKEKKGGGRSQISPHPERGKEKPQFRDFFPGKNFGTRTKKRPAKQRGKYLYRPTKGIFLGGRGHMLKLKWREAVKGAREGGNNIR